MSSEEQQQQAVDGEIIKQWILDLSNPERKENALWELSRNREFVPNLALMLYNSTGTIDALTQEIKNIYPALNPPTYTAHQFNMVYYTLTLLECIACHPGTRESFLLARIPLIFCPILRSVCTTEDSETLRLKSLGVIGSLMQIDDQQVITFVMNSEILSHSLQIMVFGCELSKTVATFILLKILLNASGLSYCSRTDRFLLITNILGKVVQYLTINPSARLLKYVVCCYVRFSETPRGRGVFRHWLPEQFRDGTFDACLQEDQSIHILLDQLLMNVGNNSA